MDDEDMIVVVVVDDDEAKSSNTAKPEVKIKLEHPSDDYQDVNYLIETAERHGEYIPLYVEPPDDYHSVYGETKLSPKHEIKSEPEDEEHEDDGGVFDYSPHEDTNESDYIPDKDANESDYSPDKDTNDSDYSPDKDTNDSDCSPDKDTNDSDCDESIEDNQLQGHNESEKKRFTMLKPHMRKSFVAGLKKEYPELRDDEELLIDTLEQIMRSMKPPPPPRDYYVMNGIMFECVICGRLTNSLPAASRHYQERHGERYLACYACGVDFRSATNLFKHEKRCVAPDANIVLRARAAFVGSKGRSRPFLPYREKGRAKPVKKINDRRFSCNLCSAKFVTQSNLQSHENLHRGVRPYRCKMCPRAYTSSCALARHKRWHSDIQYICDQCGRSFKVKGALITHLGTHNPIRKYGCSECSRRFAGKAALVLHVNKIHRNLPPPCACQICPKRYPRMALLKTHMKKVHGMSIMTRTMFFKSLPTMTDLEVKESKVIPKFESDFLINNSEKYVAS